MTYPANAPSRIARGGKAIYGAPLGILMLEARFPRIPGDMGNGTTWPFPVLYRVVRGASPERVVKEQARGLLPAQTPRIADALALVRLEGFANAYPHQLSGGMAQRAALARALVNDPHLLLLDEPLGKLDSLTRLAMQNELLALWQKVGFTALLVTHDVEEALYVANRVIVLSERPARIVAEVRNDAPYPRHRDDPALVSLRRDVLALLGLET